MVAVVVVPTVYIEAVNRLLGLPSPLIVTPEQLMEYGSTTDERTT